MNGPLILKAQYDAFWKTLLDDLLRENGIRRVVICGGLTHLCCETTTRSAFVRGYEVIFHVDATATYYLQFHTNTVLTCTWFCIYYHNKGDYW